MASDPQKHLSVLIVGTGSIGQRHARLLCERPELEVWICDIDRKCLDECRKVAPRARPIDNYETAMQQHPDAVFVCTPHALHKPMAVRAAQAGCHVMCEKPLAGTVTDAQQIVDAVEQNGKVLQVGYVARLHPAIRRLQELVQSGQLGTLVGGRVMVGTYFTLMASRRRFAQPQENVLVLDYTHEPDYLSLLFGQVQRVSAESATLGKLPLMQSPNIFSIIMRYESGALVQLHLDYVQFPNRHLIELYGDAKTAVFDSESGALTRFSHGSDVREVEYVTVGRDDVFRDQITSFLEAVRGEHPPTCTGQDGIAVLRIAEAAIRAASEHRTVELAGGG